MKDLTIILENEKQKSMLKLISKQRIIEEVTTYLQSDGTIFKTSLQRDVFYEGLSQEFLKAFFDSQTNALTEFYREKGEFKITIL